MIFKNRLRLHLIEIYPSKFYYRYTTEIRIKRLIYLYRLFRSDQRKVKRDEIFEGFWSSFSPITINLYRIKAVESSLEKFTPPPREVSFPLPFPPLLDFPRRESVCFRGRFVIQLFPRVEEERKRGETAKLNRQPL